MVRISSIVLSASIVGSSQHRTTCCVAQFVVAVATTPAIWLRTLLKWSLDRSEWLGSEADDPSWYTAAELDLAASSSTFSFAALTALRSSLTADSMMTVRN